MISPQRPCTAASNLSKSRPNSSGVFNHHRSLSQKDLTRQNSVDAGLDVSTSLLKNPNKQRKRPFPLNVRIDETKQEQSGDGSVTVIDPPSLSLNSENNEDNLRTIELMPRPTPDPIKSQSSTPILPPEETPTQRRAYKFISSPSRQIYRTIPETDSVPSASSLQQLSLNQLELLENYDPMVSAKIGVPFVPLQILARPRHAQSAVQRSIEQIHRDYPK